MAHAAYKSLSLNKPKTSRVHKLIWASRPALPFCAGLASKLATRYPVPTMLEFEGPGEYNLTGGNNLAKLHTLQRFLYGPDGAHDDDVVIATDGHDVLAQRPVDAFIERYFDTVAAADKHLAGRLASLSKKLIRETFVIDAALGLVAVIWNPEIKFLDTSDQYYIGHLMDRQDSYRTKKLTGGPARGLTRTRVLPKEKQNETDQTEFHMSLGDEHGLVQNRPINEVWLRKLNFDNSNQSAIVMEDVLNGHSLFKPYKIQMPSFFFLALRRIFIIFRI
ncbi:hypothetical protein B0J13DRAFT_532296 [Dactylonectria estremocensis]|uniref:Uncharacterized protein n=1 Tax=Dactylonectria estremocensis TaxID=1079267 RepID=A0A9P9DK28_9HYPO|nr:hypothetical protein B0J13DRAFT_532296 [Dactylonectria estremocensis]